MAENYKLSLTAEDIDSRLKKIQDGGVGYTDGETINQIEAKYLPGVCLPVVELTTVPTADGVTMTAEEAAQLDKAVEARLPIVIKIMMEYGYQVAVADYFISDGVTAFAFLNVIAKQMWCFIGVEGAWVARID